MANYRQLWTDEIFWKALGTTFRYAAMALPAGALVSLGLALMLNANIRGQAIYRAVIFSPLPRPRHRRSDALAVDVQRPLRTV
jgi:ABC-type sugar transport system permease subunit